MQRHDLTTRRSHTNISLIRRIRALRLSILRPNRLSHPNIISRYVGTTRVFINPNRHHPRDIFVARVGLRHRNFAPNNLRFLYSARGHPQRLNIKLNAFNNSRGINTVTHNPRNSLTTSTTTNANSRRNFTLR